MGDGQLRAENDDGEIFDCRCNSSEMVSKWDKFSDLFGSNSTAFP
jgi:hypothetical protein